MIDILIKELNKKDTVIISTGLCEYSYALKIAEKFSNNQNFEFESFDELSGSLDNVTFDSLISESQYNYPNLNTDFNEFAKSETSFNNCE